MTTACKSSGLTLRWVQLGTAVGVGMGVLVGVAVAVGTAVGVAGGGRGVGVAGMGVAVAVAVAISVARSVSAGSTVTTAVVGRVTSATATTSDGEAGAQPTSQINPTSHPIRVILHQKFVIDSLDCLPFSL